MLPGRLEFCGSFASAAHVDDPLYTAFRSLLATALSNPNRTTERWRDVPRRRVAEQFSRLAGDMANVLIEEVAGDEQLPPHTPAMRNLAEFKIFWSVLRAQVLEDVDAGTLRPPKRRARCLPLLSVNDWMARCETRSSMLRQQLGSSSSAVPKWTASLRSVVLAVLAELDAWPGLHEMVGATLKAHPTAVTALVLSAGRELNGNTRWITKHRDVLEFEARRHLAMAMLPEPVTGRDAPPPHEMLIDRSRLLSDSFGYIALATPRALRAAAVVVAFKHEQAAGPGVLREWFCLVCQALFNPCLVLFSPCPHDRRRFFVNPSEFASILLIKVELYFGLFRLSPVVSASTTASQNEE
jgi:E3 ubiquitin-protein ligase NEDD4